MPFNLKGGYGFLLEVVTILWFLGSVVATIAAFMLGILVELPKAYWLSHKHSGGIFAHISLSTAGALVIILLWILIADGAAPAKVQQDKDYLFPIGAFFVGGICSALFWWSLVVLPWRRQRQTS
ncbi:hypothetical protein M2336_001914 [Sphingobium sp. B1D7B]|uniref:hypothetical protein n=1 Tax=Sphingobium sp. B1D7B TaxID=2940578 RepID=UPI0022251700|nr:hypothetical protein [Sphingobium sp. B1D7B]MCW2405285.1 hypothetical protein [Sphingobium sp. B1D7B]